MSNPHLVAVIREAIQNEGPIPFVRFMEYALYHPEYGYYHTPKPKIGPQGDYYTSPSVHPVFARLLTRQLVQMVEACDAPHRDIALIEFGGGDGRLACEIIQQIKTTFPSFYERLHYILVEASASFKKQQQERLLPYTSVVQWADRMPPSCIGVVFSNELLDAFPVHRLRMENGFVKEIYVDWQDRFVETLFPVSERLNDYMKQIGLSPETALSHSMILEINLRASDWIRNVGSGLTRGFVLTFDYGYPAKQLYDPMRKRGTFLCYHQHTVNEDPYDRVGEQDMTSHVDFTSLVCAGESVGLSLLGFTDQTHFLMGLGIAQEMQVEAEKMEESETARQNFLAMKQLMDPRGMGKIFKVLIQEKGVSSTVPLEGLTFPAFPKEGVRAVLSPS